jgi:hypothetical protein
MLELDDEHAMFHCYLSTTLPHSQRSSHAIVQFVAMLFRGPKSPCYFTVIREEVDIQRIFARYSLQCVCAVLLYSMLDADKSATIDTHEVCILAWEAS